MFNELINNENIKFYRMDFERGWILIVYQNNSISSIYTLCLQPTSLFYEINLKCSVELSKDIIIITHYNQ